MECQMCAKKQKKLGFDAIKDNERFDWCLLSTNDWLSNVISNDDSIGLNESGNHAIEIVEEWE